MSLPLAQDSFTAGDCALRLSLDRHSRLSQLRSSTSSEQRRANIQIADTVQSEQPQNTPHQALADEKSLRDANTSASEVVRDATALPQPPATATDSEEVNKKLSAAAIALIMTPLCLSVLLSALDLTIITPAIPAIVSGFHSTTGYVWIGSAFILASTASTPVWASLADIWGRKPILLIALTIFLGGSLLCALAPSMHSLIAGRALQGLGSSGMGTMVNVIICDTFSLRDRGLYLAITSVVWAIGSAVGPVIGGTFTTRLNWRWCFWINLPIGAVVFFVLVFFLKLPSPHTPVLAGLKAIDWTGSILIVGAALMILLGLDFGSITFPWSSATVICLIVFGIVTIAFFLVNEWKFAKNPIMPLRLFTKSSTVAAYLVWACNFYVLIGLSYYLPLYSQSVLGVDALTSGIHLIPLIVACSLSAACVGAYIQKTGKYLPITYVAHVLLCLGSGLFINLKLGEGLTKLIIFEIITGLGVGMNIEPPLIAAQAAMTVMDTAVIQGAMTFMRSLATTVAVVVGGVIFQNRMNAVSRGLIQELGEELASKFNGDEASASVELIRTLPAGQQLVVKDAYFRSLKSVWIMFVVAAVLSFIANFFLRAHHLSDTAKAAVLGVDRAKKIEPQQTSDGLASSQSVELRQQNGNSARARPAQRHDVVEDVR
ncbi:MFS general substrate transporter [Decorospora gaudefroyi]|uniref:MFS general substrate transporter n=1 Tax=Decorospora gaudefroyi TaxID=184978 RepID=A0A6A5KDV4_9PLEO|nr:MFS general substrate transporter [Decorospora gaudefroyi]